MSNESVPGDVIPDVLDLKLNELSPDIIKEMTTEMERLPQHVSLNLGRAFIDTYSLTIKAKTVTCAQLLVKTFKHRGAQIEVSQFLQFLHQFGDRKVAESFCDLLISWYRHETMQHKNKLFNSRQLQQQMTPILNSQNNTFQQAQQPQSQTVTPVPQRHQQVSPLGTVGVGGGLGGVGLNPIYGSALAAAPAHLRTPVLRHSASIPASATMATTYYQPQPQQPPTQQHFVQTSNNMAAGKFFNNNNNHLAHHAQSPLMTHAFNGSSQSQQQQHLQQQQQQPSTLPISTAVNTTSESSSVAAQNMQHLVNYAQMPTLNVHKRPVQEENSSEVGEDDVFD